MVGAFSDDCLSIKWLYACDDRITMLIDPVNINVNLLIFIEGNNIVVDCHKSKDKGEYYCQ